MRVQVSTLTYELANIKQERELEAIRFEKETRSLQLKADADFRKAQVSFTRESMMVSWLTHSTTGSRIRQSPGYCENRSSSERTERNPRAIIE